MKKLNILALITVLIFSMIGCEAKNQTTTINELELKQIAWESLDKSTKNLIIGDENDIQYEGSIVPMAVNNAPADVWKEAKLKVVDHKYYLPTNINTKSEKIIVITFETISDSKILRYIDPVSKKVIYKQIVPPFQWEQ